MPKPGRPKRAERDQPIPPTPERLNHVRYDHPIDQLHHDGKITAAHHVAGSVFAYVTWRVFGRPFASVGPLYHRIANGLGTGQDGRGNGMDDEDAERLCSALYEALKACGVRTRGVVERVCVYHQPLGHRDLPRLRAGLQAIDQALTGQQRMREAA